MSTTKIEWTNKTWNPITGCTKVSAGCQHCYAERMARRLAGRFGYPEAPHHFDVTLHPDRLDEPLRWRKPRRVFVCSMSDLFHEDVPDEYICDVFYTMHRCTQHTFQVLTKRPARMLEWFNRPAASLSKWHRPLPNVWLGVTAENQKAADERIPLLLKCPAAVRFVSCEPLLGEIVLEARPNENCRSCFGAGFQRGGMIGDVECHCWGDGYLGSNGGPSLDWVIVGGESGPGARPMDPSWARSLRDQCQDAGVAFFFKQWGEWIHENQANDSLRPTSCGGLGALMDRGKVITLDGESFFWRVGKKRAGRLLDGREWNEYPI
jgi:protein gp37